MHPISLLLFPFDQWFFIHFPSGVWESALKKAARKFAVASGGVRERPFISAGACAELFSLCRERERLTDVGGKAHLARAEAK